MARRFQFAGGVAALALLAAGWLALRSSEGAASAVATPGSAAPEAEAAEAALELRRPEHPAPSRARDAEDALASALESTTTGARERVEVAEPRSRVLRGRVVDSRTGQGLPCVEVAPYTIGEKAGDGVVSDLEGRFEVDTRDGQRDFVLVLDRARDGVRMGRRSVERWLAESTTPSDLLWPLEVGPTLIVRLRGAPPTIEGWRIRLLERHSSSEELDWEWCESPLRVPDGWLVARYRRYESPPESRHRAWIQVGEPTETWRGEVAIDTTLGVHQVEIDVLPVGAALGGRVIDERGKPVDATVIALRRGVRRAPDTDWPQGQTNENGEWQLSGLEAGPTRLLVLSDHRPVHRQDVELARGESKTLEIVLAPLAPAGAIRGTLVGPREGDDPSAIVRLESVDGGSTRLAAWCFELDFFGHSEPDGRAGFEFDSVPAGRYTLSVLAIDGRSYAPASIEVEAPAEIEFRTEELVGPGRELSYELVLCDAETGARIRDPVGLFHLDPFWSSQVESGDPVQELGGLGERSPVSVVVGRAGYRPAFLYLPDAYRSARREGDRVEVRLDLQPGYGAALVVVDAERMTGGRNVELSDLLPMEGLAGARVIANGRVVGTSDARGLALCASAGPIEDFEVELPGWTVLACDRFRGHAETPDGLGFVLMARD